MMRIAKKNINVEKAANYAIITNASQILIVLAMIIYILCGGTVVWNRTLVTALVLFAGLVVVWGALLDIREALRTRKELDKMDAMDESLHQIEELNRALRSQRHDFLNHLQVVYSLMEMQEYTEASDYIEKVYGDMQSVSRVMRTQSPAINALLRVKIQECEQAGIAVNTDVTGSWKTLPMPAWEMCRVLSNLIDNARDVLRDLKGKTITISLREDLKGFHFSVSNNGPAIPPERVEKIFDAGVSSKGEGRGMGLYIVRKTLSQYGGEIHAESSAQLTSFIGFVPRNKGENVK